MQVTPTWKGDGGILSTTCSPNSKVDSICWKKYIDYSPRTWQLTSRKLDPIRFVSQIKEYGYTTPQE